MMNSFSRFLGFPRKAFLGLSLAAIAALDPIHSAIATPTSSAPKPELQTHSDLPQEDLSSVQTLQPATWGLIESNTPDVTIPALEYSQSTEAANSQVRDPQATVVSPAVSEPRSTNRLIAQLGSSCEDGLKVENVRGIVTFEGRVLQQGQCLQPAIGTFASALDSSARLRLDNFRGSIEVSEVSEFNVETLSDSDVELFVQQGQVRFSLGRLSTDSAALPSSNSVAMKTLSFLEEDPLITQDSGGDSPFRVRTPTGVAGVRGTSFGVDVGPNGQTGVRTVDGSVVASGQGTQVTVGRGQFTVISPGAAPSAPAEIPPESKFRVLVTQTRGMDVVRIQGKIDAPDILLLNGELVETNPDGSFSMMVPRPASRRLRFVVRGPAVRERVYVIPVE